jgi:hypothetical protein
LARSSTHCSETFRDSALAEFGRLDSRGNALAAVGIRPRAESDAADLRDRALRADILRADEKHDGPHEPEGVAQHQAFELTVVGAAPVGADEEGPTNLDLAALRVIAVEAGHPDDRAGCAVDDLLAYVKLQPWSHAT